MHFKISNTQFSHVAPTPRRHRLCTQFVRLLLSLTVIVVVVARVMCGNFSTETLNDNGKDAPSFAVAADEYTDDNEDEDDDDGGDDAVAIKLVGNLIKLTFFALRI